MSTGEITHLIRQTSAGDQVARDRLFELAYPKLRQLAGAKMRGERAGRTCWHWTKRCND